MGSITRENAYNLLTQDAWVCRERAPTEWTRDFLKSFHTDMQTGQIDRRAFDYDVASFQQMCAAPKVVLGKQFVLPRVTMYVGFARDAARKVALTETIMEYKTGYCQQKFQARKGAPHPFEADRFFACDCDERSTTALAMDLISGQLTSVELLYGWLRRHTEVIPQRPSRPEQSARR